MTQKILKFFDQHVHCYHCPRLVMAKNKPFDALFQPKSTLAVAKFTKEENGRGGRKIVRANFSQQSTIGVHYFCAHDMIKMVCITTLVELFIF